MWTSSNNINIGVDTSDINVLVDDMPLLNGTDFEVRIEYQAKYNKGDQSKLFQFVNTTLLNVELGVPPPERSHVRIQVDFDIGQYRECLFHGNGYKKDFTIYIHKAELPHYRE